MKIETSSQETPPKSLYTFLHVEVDDITNYPDAITDICENKIHGIVIHNAFSKDEGNAVSKQLTRVGPFPNSNFGDILIYGPALYVSESNLSRYRKEASEFRTFCSTLFSSGRDFEKRLESILSTLSNNGHVSVPLAEDGQPYTPATIRILEQEQDMGWHFENQFLHCTAGYRHLSTLIEHHDHLSYFLVLEAAEKGGELVLYDMQWSETEWLDKEVGGIRRWGTVNGRPIGDIMEYREKMYLNPPAGSLVVFDGGRILHKVSKVVTAQRRATIGGFVAYSKGREQLYYWS